MGVPSRLVMVVPGLDPFDAEVLAVRATKVARQLAPKLTGKLGDSLVPLWSPDAFGIGWSKDYAWFQEKGINPFVMRSLEGKTIPMWIDDPTGQEQRANPKAKTRVMANGRVQVLIFRRAANWGERKLVNRRVGGKVVQVDVPRSYPGAPGRINRRETDPITSPGKVTGQIARGNVGVRWRHPGLEGTGFITHAIESTAFLHGIYDGRIEIGGD